ncbi:MAG: ornithine carbamoyltransferase [Salaquimonas sp.]
MTATPKNFIDLSKIESKTLSRILDYSTEEKLKFKSDPVSAAKPLAGKVMAMIFEKPSTRTRVSFDVGMRQLGGETIFLSGSEMQLGRSETIADTAKVLSRYVDIIMIRTTDHKRLTELAEHATVPVINGLTDDTHPCQIMADLMTFQEHRGPLKGKKFAWSGDGNNVLHSLIEGSARFEYDMAIAVPKGSEPDMAFVEWANRNGGNVTLTEDPVVAVSGADCIVTDCWISMNQEHRARGHNVFQPYQVNEKLMAHANKDALFMHCLPAHRGEEVTDAVMDGPQSVVFDEAENRLHAQKGIISWCMNLID